MIKYTPIKKVAKYLRRIGYCQLAELISPVKKKPREVKIQSMLDKACKGKPFKIRYVFWDDVLPTESFVLDPPIKGFYLSSIIPIKPYIRGKDLELVADINEYTQEIVNKYVNRIEKQIKDLQSIKKVV